MEHSNFKQGSWAKSPDGVFGADSVQGIANLSEDGVILDIPCGEILGEPGVRVNGVEESSASDYLYGFSQDGYFLVLANASYIGGDTNYPGMPHQIIRADYMLAAKGREFKPDGLIKKAVVGILALTDWYHKSAFAMKYEKSKDGGLLFKSLQYEPDEDRPCVLLETGDFKATLFGRYTIPGLRLGEMTFRQKCLLEVVFSTGKTIEEVRDLAIDFSKFFSLCGGFHMPVQKLELYFEDGDARPVQYYAPFLDAPMPSKSTLQSMPFPYLVVESDIDRYLSRWFNVGNEVIDNKDFGLLRNASDVTVSVLSYDWKMPVELLFVVVAQAFEALTKYKADMTSFSKQEHKNNKKELIRRLEGMPCEYRDWLLNLADRNTKSAGRLASELMGRHPVVTHWLIPDTSKFLKEFRDLRNACAHASGSKKSDYQRVFDMARGVALVCYAIVWELLGMDSDQICLRLNKSRFKSIAIEWLRDYFSRPKDGSDPAA